MRATQILKRSNEDKVEGRRICSLSWFRETKQASDWNFCRRVGSWSESVVVEWFFDVKLVRLWEQIRRNASFRCRLYYCQLLCIAWCVCAIKDGGIWNAKKKNNKIFRKDERGRRRKKKISDSKTFQLSFTPHIVWETLRGSSPRRFFLPALFAISLPARSTDTPHLRNSAPWMRDNSASRLLNLRGVPLFRRSIT